MSTVKIIEQPGGFKPITLSITLESEAELKALRLLSWRSYDSTTKCINDNTAGEHTTAEALEGVLNPIYRALVGHA